MRNITPDVWTTSSCMLSVFSDANYATLVAGKVPAGADTAAVPTYIWTASVPGLPEPLPGGPIPRCDFRDIVPTATINDTGKDSVDPSDDRFPKGSCFADIRTAVVPGAAFAVTTVGSRIVLIVGTFLAFSFVVDTAGSPNSVFDRCADASIGKVEAVARDVIAAVPDRE